MNRNGRNALKVDALQAAVLKALDGVDGTHLPEGHDTPWTEAVLEALSRAGDDLGHYVCASKKPAGARHGEWLWDCTWVEYPNRDPSAPLLSVPVVAECEWKDWEQIKYDFEKLLAANVSLRIMVFNGRQGIGQTIAEKSRDIARELLSWVRGAKAESVCEVRYLLAAWEQFAKPTFRYFQIALDQHGTESSWELHEITPSD